MIHVGVIFVFVHTGLRLLRTFRVVSMALVGRLGRGVFIENQSCDLQSSVAPGRLRAQCEVTLAVQGCAARPNQVSEQN